LTTAGVIWFDACFIFSKERKGICMDPVSKKVKQWIAAGKDPRSAHWQGGLEAILEVFKPYLKPGQLVPVTPLGAEDQAVFLSVLGLVDLSPNLLAAFLPPPVAEKITPPESAEELRHIEKEELSYKIIIARQGTEKRILCAEVSEHAHKPGVDIFESGALLGTYNFENRKDCFTELNKIIRTHVWEKGKWCQDDYKRYTLNWFEKVVDLQTGAVDVDKDRSVFHSPSLIKSNKVDVIFLLIDEILQNRFQDANAPLQEAVAAIQMMDDGESKKARLNNLIDTLVLDLLTVMKNCDLLSVEAFSEKEMAQFHQESARTIQKLEKLVAV
jgi:hypothetical protein